MRQASWEFKMYDRETASKSAHGISLYVSSDRKVATKYSDRQRQSYLISMALRLYDRGTRPIMGFGFFYKKVFLFL